MDIPLGAVLNFVPQHIHGLNGHLPQGLFDGGQLDAGQLRRGDVVEADETEVPGNVDPQFVARMTPRAWESVEAKMAV